MICGFSTDLFHSCGQALSWRAIPSGPICSARRVSDVRTSSSARRLPRPTPSDISRCSRPRGRLVSQFARRSPHDVQDTIERLAESFGQTDPPLSAGGALAICATPGGRDRDRGKMSVKRILVYTPGLLPISQTFVADQARALQRWSPTLVGRERLDDGAFIGDLSAAEMLGSDAELSLPQRTVQRVTRRVPLLRDTVSRLRPDLIHAHFLTGGFDVLASLRPLPCPLVVTAHGFDATWFGSPPGLYARNNGSMAYSASTS